jgi:formamidopyrimidine-DNA glycosylase
MPELPEVETVTRALSRYLLGRKIFHAECFIDTLRYPLELDKFEDLKGRTIIDIRRRAKYIIFELDNQQCLLTHLGMTGSWRLEPVNEPRRKHDHVAFFLDHEEVLRYNDPRRFGFIKISTLTNAGDEPASLPQLAPEPLSPEFDIAWLTKVCSTRTKPIKNLIMDNALVVGVGNIYASEALFRAGIRPQTIAKKISKPRIKKLHAAIIEVLEEAIEAGGTTIINFTSLNSQEGYFARDLNVYNRFGILCTKCQRGKINRLVMAGRSTYYCPVCQR